MGSPLLWLIGSWLVTQLVFTGHAALRWALARRLGLQVARVRLGWGPKLKTLRTRAGVEIEIRPLPPLAMVAIRGHDPLPDTPSYRALHGRSDLGKRILLTLSSPASYALLTALPLFAQVFLIGSPESLALVPMQVEDVAAGSPAELAGILPDDVIVRANGVDVRAVADLARVVAPRSGLPTNIELRRGGRALTLTVTPTDVDGKGRVGVRAKIRVVRKRMGFVEAGAWAFAKAGSDFAGAVASAFGVFGTQVRTIGGPVAIVRMTGAQERSNLELALWLLSAIGLRFWFLTCFPLPFCAGGRLLLLLPEALGRPQPSLRIERAMTWIGATLYLSLSLLALISDLRI